MKAKKILIIDDNPPIRSLLDTLFNNAGYVVHATGDGGSALTMAEQGGFTFILLDLKMPGINGLDFLKQVKSLTPPQPNGPIVVFTSQSEDIVREAALKAGAAAYIQKDEANFQTLPQTIEKLIK